MVKIFNPNLDKRSKKVQAPTNLHSTNALVKKTVVLMILLLLKGKFTKQSFKLKKKITSDP